MSKHTKEPWENFSELCEPYSAHPDSDGFVRLDFYDYTRASSCVNACAGMEDPMAEIAELKRQRDELLGLIKAITAHSVMVCVDGTDCAAIPYFEYKVISDKVSGR